MLSEFIVRCVVLLFILRIKLTCNVCAIFDVLNNFIGTFVKTIILC